VSTNGDVASAEVQTLFLVTIGLDGQSRVVIDPEARFTAQRLATPQDVYPALANCLADYQAIKTAEAILSFQTQIARSLQTAAAQEGSPE
jgi:hypothetical protein